jgi:hypothetical protein
MRRGSTYGVLLCSDCGALLAAAMRVLAVLHDVLTVVEPHLLGGKKRDFVDLDRHAFGAFVVLLPCVDCSRMIHG